MADEDEAEVEGEEEEGGGKPKIPMWIIILVVSQVVVVGGAIAAFIVLSGGSKEEVVEEGPTVEEQKVDPTKVKDAAALIGPQFDLDPFIVNLIDDGRGPRYLKTEMKFELEAEEVRPEVEGRLSQIRDEILMLLTSKRITDVETSDGKRILKDEIFTRVNKILVTGRIKRVYFTEFVIQ
jgi:flagellar FliL protein